MAENKMPTMTDEQFREFLAAIRPPTPPPPLTEEEQFHKLEQMAQERPLLKEFPYGRVKSRTGATFVPRLVASRGFKSGRVVELVDYVHPEGTTVQQSQGGLVPDGMPVTQKTEAGEVFSVAYKQWRYDRFWKRDLADYIGIDASLLPPAYEPAVVAGKAAE